MLLTSTNWNYIALHMFMVYVFAFPSEKKIEKNRVSS